VIFEDQLTFDEQKKRAEIEQRTSEIHMLIKQAKLQLEELDADAKVRRSADRSDSPRAACRS
jgi:prophage antirepressor-like protein